MKKTFYVFFIVFIIVISQALYCEAHAPKYKIGIVFDLAGRGDKSFNDGAYMGLKMLAQEFKGYIKGDPDKVNYGNEIELKYLEPKQGGQDREQLLRVLAEDGYDLIFGIGSSFSDSIGKVANDFPKVHFAVIDGSISNLTKDSNLTCISFSENEGSFLIGALCGMIIKDMPNAKLGFLGGMDNPLVHKFQAGFVSGASYINSRLSKKDMILVQYIGKDGTAFRDPKTAATIASALYKKGAEIIFHAAGGSGAGLFEAAKLSKKWAIGVDTDQGLSYITNEKDPAARDVGKFIMTSMLKRVDQAIFSTGETLIKNGKVDGGYKILSLAVDGVGIAINQYNKDYLSPYLSRIEEIKKQIIQGEIIVPLDDAGTKKFLEKLH